MCTHHIHIYIYIYICGLPTCRIGEGDGEKESEDENAATKHLRAERNSSPPLLSLSRHESPS